MNYRIAPQARADLAGIWEFIARDNLAAADQVIDTIRAKVLQISHNVELGRLREELAPGLRSLVIRRYPRYIIFYRVASESVEIVRVLDGARDFKDAFKPE